MQLRGTRRRKSADRGFVLSDHADWAGLNSAIKETGAENVYVTHGYKSTFARWLREDLHINAVEVDTLYEGETLNENTTPENEIDS
jgi:putative mRNA 3-end processing factor